MQGKYERLMALLPELCELALRGEDYLYQKHDTNSATSLLIEMLHARRREWRCGRAGGTSNLWKHSLVVM